MGVFALRLPRERAAAAAVAAALFAAAAAATAGVAAAAEGLALGVQLKGDAAYGVYRQLCSSLLPRTC